MGKRFSYLSGTTLPTDDDGLVDWLSQALDIPVGLFTHGEDVGLQFLKRQGVKGHVREGLNQGTADPMMAETRSLPTAGPRGLPCNYFQDVPVSGPTVGPRGGFAHSPFLSLEALLALNISSFRFTFF